MNFAPLSSVIAADTKTVTVTAPAPFLLRLDDNSLIRVEAGVQEAPEFVADHPYSLANGLTRYAPAVPVAAADAATDESAPAKRGPGRPPKAA